MPRAEETPPLYAKIRVGDQSDTSMILLSALPQSLLSGALDAVDALAEAVLVAPALRHDHFKRQPHDAQLMASN